MSPASPQLERYALKVHQYSRITGVALGAHAIEDAQHRRSGRVPVEQ